MSRYRSVRRRDTDAIDVLRHTKKSQQKGAKGKNREFKKQKTPCASLPVESITEKLNALSSKNQQAIHKEKEVNRPWSELPPPVTGLDHNWSEVQTEEKLQRTPDEALLVHQPNTSMKRKLEEDDFTEYRGDCHLSALEEERVFKKRKLVRNLSDEHRIRRSKLKYLPSKFVGSSTRSKPAGFFNPNNMCYRRSVMQSLVNLPLFGNWLAEYFKAHKCNHLATERSCVLCTFSNLLDNYTSGKPGTGKFVAEFDRAIKAAGRHSCYDWTGNAQQADASELILFLIQNFIEQTEWPEAIRALFQTQLVSEWTCENCKEVSTSAPVDETFLSVPIDPLNMKEKKSPSLEDYVARYFVDEAPDVTCPRCHSKGDRNRSMRINAAPAVLFIIMKRFKYDLYGESSKIKTTVPYGEYLDLSAFSSNPQSMRYKLASVVAHSGSMKAGHYITYGSDSVTGRLFKYNDESVTEASTKHLLEPPGGFTPYVLTYVSSDGKKGGR